MGKILVRQQNGINIMQNLFLSNILLGKTFMFNNMDFFLDLLTDLAVLVLASQFG